MKISGTTTTILLLAASSPLSRALNQLMVDESGAQKLPLKLGLVFNDVKCKTYSMTFADRNFMHREKWPLNYVDGLGNPNIDSGMSWGLHALQWKAMQDTKNNGGEYDVDLANDSNAPARNPNVGENHVSLEGSDILNDLESANSGIFTDSNGMPKDPSGTWENTSEDNALAGAILAAMNMFYWDTPTYVDTRDWKGHDGGVAVIKKVRLCAEGFKDPDVVCNWLPRGSYASTCAGTDTLSIEWIEAARFDASGKYSDEAKHGTHILTGTEWKDIYGKPGVTPVLVFDPPQGTTTAEIDAVKRQAEGIAHKSLIDPGELDSMISDNDLTLAPGGLRG